MKPYNNYLHYILLYINTGDHVHYSRTYMAYIHHNKGVKVTLSCREFPIIKVPGIIPGTTGPL